MRTLLLSVPLAALAATFFFACGDSGSGTGGAGGTTSTTTSTTKASSTSGTTTSGTTTTTGTMSTGTGGMCMDDGTCDFGNTDADCTCADCVMAAQCGGCVADQMCSPDDDACTCKDCWYDGFCGDPANCMDDGVCDDYNEGCGCADCANAPNCSGYMPPPAVPATWTCSADYWADGSCDCGCGAVDFDCADATKASCDFCEDMGSCDEGVMCSDAMSKIDPANNAVCTTP